MDFAIIDKHKKYVQTTGQILLGSRIEKNPFNTVVRFDNNHPNSMLIKHTRNGEFIEVNVGKRGSRLADRKTLKDLKRKYNGSITLIDKQIADLKKLINYIPPIASSFLLTLVEI
nr:unnamed protein product [Callosobruchus analis]